MTGQRFAIAATTRKEQRQIPGYGKRCACVVTDYARMSRGQDFEHDNKIVFEGEGLQGDESLVGPASRPGDVTLQVANYSQLDGYSCAAVSGFAVVKTFHPDADF